MSSNNQGAPPPQSQRPPTPPPPFSAQQPQQQHVDDEEELGPPKADFSAPPPYELTDHNNSNSNNNTQSILQHHQQQQSEMHHHGKLPTYQEVQIEKCLNGELPVGFLLGPQPPQRLPPPPNPLLANLPGANVNGGDGTLPGATPALTFIAIDASDAENLTSGTTDTSLLGTDIMFITAFMVAFLFNWIGFLMLTCFCHTIAARYGALSGFGLSLAKWTLIVKHSTELASHENSWLWWLIMAFGFLICVRALVQYVSIKRTWRLLSASAQERLLFFY